MKALKSVFAVSLLLMYACASGPNPETTRVVELHVPGCN